MNERFLKPYDPASTEERLYRRWEESGYFDPEKLPATSEGERSKAFTIIMPPPNANGHLHAGHALFITLEDIMTRYKRMRGYKALWAPGADHAGFETQIVYEKKLEKEGRSRFKMEPKQLFDEIMAFTLENKKYMEAEVRAMGASCDWSREKFTLDPEVVAEVHKTFKKMHDDGLVYRGGRIVNWCPKHQTSLSDVETETAAKKDPFYYFKYGPFVIGTARPETKFGDKYVVMHPADKRYAEYKDGQKIELEWINGPITATVIKDEAIDMEFGTGVMTITPWHSDIDFEIAERHGLDKEQIIDWRGRLLPIAGEFAGMKIDEARPKIVEKLKTKGLLEKVDEAYEHNVPVCYKCGTVIEPQVKEQWFVRMKPLTALAAKAVEDGSLSFIPDNYRKIFLHWMNNPIDWNVSRQIVWGIPIPAKLCGEAADKPGCGWAGVDLDGSVKQCPKCGGPARADTDTFDTWFSSGQWPLLLLGYQNDLPAEKQSAFFKTYYPTDVMETGSDLIFKWVPRMVIFGLYLAKTSPFRTVYLHGLVNDAQGKKMSKSKGNVINPIDLTSKYGTDALRMALVVANTPGTDTALSEARVKGYKNFANKLWNVARFVLSNAEGVAYDASFSAWSERDRKLVEEQDALMSEITREMDEYKFHLVSEKLYHYVWHALADLVLEETKPILGGIGPGGVAVPAKGTAAEQLSRRQFLLRALHVSLLTLHPFMPFVTEEIWQLMHGGEAGETPKEGMLMIAEWPKVL